MTVQPVPATWVAGPEHPELVRDAVHVWRFSLHAPENDAKNLEACLDPGERTRADRFARADLRQQFVVGHGRLRRVLMRYLNRAPEDVAVEITDKGKPILVTGQSSEAIDFSFAHSGDLGVVALALNRRIGVDVETYRERMDIDLVARRQFTAAESDGILALPKQRREAAFYRCWTRKEAYAKALGQGIAAGLDRFEVSFGEDDPPRIVRCIESTPENWAVIPLAVGPGFEGACVVERPAVQVEAFRLDSD